MHACHTCDMSHAAPNLLHGVVFNSRHSCSANEVGGAWLPQKYPVACNRASPCYPHVPVPTHTHTQVLSCSFFADSILAGLALQRMGDVAVRVGIKARAALITAVSSRVSRTHMSARRAASLVGAAA